MIRPIIFSAPMIRALLDGRKTQTRRVIKPQPVVPFSTFPDWIEDEPAKVMDGVIVRDSGPTRRIPIRYATGDRLWVREAHAIVPPTAYRASSGVETRWSPDDDYRAAVYREGWTRCKPGKWRPSIHMPRWASRLTLTVTDVRVQRIAELTDADAIAEGIDCHGSSFSPSVIYAKLWDELNAKRGFPWESNPWIVALTFHTELSSVLSDL